MTLRRIMLVLTSMLLLVDVALIMWLRSPAVKAMLESSVIKIAVEKPDVATKIKAKLDGTGRQAKIDQNVTMDRLVPAGFKVCYSNKDPESLKSVAETLKHDKIPAKVVDNEVIVGIYPNEKKAQAVLAKVAKYGFQIAENQKTVSQKVAVVSCLVEGQEAVEALKTEVINEFKLRPTDVTVEKAPQAQ